MRQKITLVFALALAVASVVFINIYLKTQEDQSRELGNTVEVIVAARNIERGSIFDASMIDKASIPEKYIHNSAVGIAERNTLLNRTASNTIPRGQVILWSDVDRSYEAANLSNAIEKGMRAVTISVDQISGVAGHVSPDDWVDVIATFIIPREYKIGADNISGKATTEGNQEIMQQIYSQIAGGGDMLEIRKVTLTLMQRVKVLAVGSITGQTGGFNIPGSSNVAPGVNNSLNSTNRMRQTALAAAMGGGGYNSVTLLVEPIDAEILAFCADKGSLSLALRNPEDTQVYTGESRLPKIILPDILDLEKSERVRARPTPRPRTPTGPRIIDNE